MKCDKNNLGHGCIEFASRCVNYNSNNNRFNFRMFYVDGGTVNANWLYDSNNNSYAVRPLVAFTDLGCIN